MRVAILDFGTNTFNLLIAEHDNKKLEYLHSSKQAVKLGQGGIIDNIIQPDAIDRALEAIKNHFVTIREFNVDKTYAFATSAVRDAKNSRKFLTLIQKQFDLYVNVIPGEREAELIYKGVRQSFMFNDEKILIIDIGGGSNECIIADKQKIFWKKSYNLGTARLLEKFKPGDPISESEIDKVERFLTTELDDLVKALQAYNPGTIIGASGSFETFYALIQKKLPEKYTRAKGSAYEFQLEDYRGLHEILLKSTLAERMQMPGMEPVRVEMIVLASIFVNFILNNHRFSRLFLSEYALKEGVIAETLNI